MTDGGEPLEENLPASAMRGTEPMYGYLVALELGVVAVLNLVVTHGPGAPKHPSRPLEFVGLAAAIGLIGLIQTKNRFLVGFATMVTTLLIVLPQVPQSLVAVHFVALLIAFVYGFLLTRRQSKARLAEAGSARTGGGSRSGRSNPADRRTDTVTRQQERWAKRRGLTTPSGPKPSRRYTPPKPRRARPPS